MKNFITYLALIGITVFLFTLFPQGREFMADVKTDFLEKKGNVTEEYERIKGKVTDISDKAMEAKAKAEALAATVNDTIDTVQATSDKINEIFNLKEEVVKAAEESEEEQETWRISDPVKDISIVAGRTNYNLADPGDDGLNDQHLNVDIKPWIEWGASADDKSTKEQRINALATTDLGRAMLEKLGYEL